MKRLILIAVFLQLLIAASYTQPNTTITPANKEVTENSLKKFFIKDSLVSAPTLNAFFATKISTYLSEATDLSISKAYAVLDNSDGRLFIGGTFNKKKSTTEFSRILITVGVKANIKDGFANLFNSDGINNDIGFNLKATIFGRGSIWFNKDATVHKNKVANKRRHLGNELIYDFDNELTKFKTNLTGLPDSVDALTTYIAEYSNEMSEQFAKKESEFLIKKQLYNVAHDWWLSFDFYLPVTNSTYETVKSFAAPAVISESYRPYEFSLVYTNFWVKNRWIGNPFIFKGTNLLTIKGSVIANNSVNASLLDSYSYENYRSLSQNPIDTLVKLKSRSLYVGNFERFITPRISLRYVYMPLSFIGVSAALEKSFGKLDDLNWRLGIPVSLKDNEGKAKVNFELVWREIGKEHSVGLSVGLPIGYTIF